MRTRGSRLVAFARSAALTGPMRMLPSALPAGSWKAASAIAPSPLPR